VLNAALLPELEFQMVWINNSNATAIDVQVTDVIPAGTTYVAGSLTCIPDSPLTTSAGAVTPPLNTGVANCAYDAANNRIQWQGNIAPDPGATSAATAANEMTITFRVTVLAGVNQVNNQGSSLTDTDGDTPSDFTDEITAASVSISNIASWNRGGGGGGGQGDPGTLPATGYPPGVVTTLPAQPEESRYLDLGDMWLEIPALGVKLPIVGVPQAQDGEWDVTWLWDQAGWLQGTAFPTWQGNSVLTSHVYQSNGLPGPFISLGRLRWGDLVIVHAFGDRYIYEVRSNEILRPNDVSVLDHEERAWLTLLTCMNYQEHENRYAYRIAARAVLVKVAPE
jgi:LPXTG-site transpeptidase (sortase) family protein